jgi:lipopolysaccharide cholinephosphotransferase
MGIVCGKFFSESDLRSDGLRELSQEERRQLQVVLLRMLKDVINVCKKHNFCYMLIYGSALGAVRHGGFIPWDDDLDIGMLRKDYVPFLEAFGKEYGDKYEVIYPRDDSHSLFTCIFGKIYLKEKNNPVRYELSSPFSEGPYVDVFPIENMPNNVLKYRFYEYLFYILRLCVVSSVRIYEFSKLSHSEIAFKKYPFYAKRIFHFYRLRYLLGFTFSFFTYNKWCYLYDKWISSFPKSNFLGIPSVPKKHPLRYRLRREVFIPIRIETFEREYVNIPGDTHKYLVSVYGNYMQIPKESVRESHAVVEIKKIIDWP